MGRTRKQVFVVIVVDECFGDLSPFQPRHFREGASNGTNAELDRHLSEALTQLVRLGLEAGLFAVHDLCL